MTTDETLPTTARRIPSLRQVVGALVATIAIATMVPTAALAQNNEDQITTTSNPYFVPDSNVENSVGESGASQTCATGETGTDTSGSLVCVPAVGGESGGTSGSLPQTGSSPSLMLGFGALAMIAGAMFLAAARRRRHPLDGMPLSG